MSMFHIAQFLNVNQAVDGLERTDRELHLPSRGYVARYTPWQHDEERDEDLAFSDLCQARDKLISSGPTGVLFV